MGDLTLETIEEIFTRALNNHRKNDFRLAENLYRDILKIDSNHFESNFLLGTLSAQIKNFQQAKKLIQKAIQIKPNHANAHYNLGKCHEISTTTRNFLREFFKPYNEELYKFLGRDFEWER